MNTNPLPVKRFKGNRFAFEFANEAESIRQFYLEKTEQWINEKESRVEFIKALKRKEKLKKETSETEELLAASFYEIDNRIRRKLEAEDLWIKTALESWGLDV